MKADPDTSTITLGDRRFPACCLICPPAEGQADDDRSRLLGGRARHSHQYMVPCENGVLIAIEESTGSPDLYHLSLLARTCELSTRDPDGPLWLPWFVGLLAGRLVHDMTRSTWWWNDAEPDWACEFIDRVSSLSFAQPPGPAVEIVTLSRSMEIEGALG